MTDVVAPVASEDQSFHADGTSSKATIYLSPLSVQQYVAAGENIPIDIYFTGSYPCISYRLQNGEIAGDVPIKTSEIQKNIYTQGQRYIRKWDLKLASGRARQSTMLWMTVVTLICIGLAIGLTWHFCKKGGSTGPTFATPPQVIQY